MNLDSELEEKVVVSKNLVLTSEKILDRYKIISPDHIENGKIESELKNDIIGSPKDRCNNLSLDNLSLDESDNMRALYRFATSLGFPSNENVNNQEWYYGVYLPHDVRLQCGEDPVHVYTDKAEALKVMKQSKKARFKQFKSWKEASEFAQNGAEVVANSTSTLGAEKSMPYKGPKPQDMVKFRKAIEAGDIAAVRGAIEDNPRYLFSSGDTPSILQEGCRYNALHVAARANQAEIAALILQSVTSLQLLGRLFEDPDEEALHVRSNVLLDLYLNTPDKSCNETPLHFAVKNGSVEVVELLTSFPECQRGLINKYGQSIKDLVCTRASDEGGKKKKAILDLLEERFFLPVLRYEDNSVQPMVGEPFSPNKPLEIQADPLSPRIEMQAYAGPMNKNQVAEFRKKWRMPPATIRNSALRLRDPEKGLERIGRQLSHEMKVPWKEYWSFLETFVDLSSPEGLALLEKYLARRFDETANENIWAADEDLEPDPTVSSGKEALSPISDLCQIFKSCSLNDVHRSPSRETPKKSVSSKVRQRKPRRDFSFGVKSEEIAEHSGDGSQQFSSLLCVERSCQVFGKRIANALMHVCSTADVCSMSADCLKDSLEPEVKHLKALVTGYLDDSRFYSVDFSVVHTRVASIAASAVQDIVTPSELTLLFACLKEIVLADGTVSDDEDILFSSRRDDHSSLGAILKTHLLCLTECLLTELMPGKKKPSSVQSEVDCITLWSQTNKCACEWEANTHLARARAAWRRKHKLLPKLLNFPSEDEKSSIDESWRSCEDAQSLEEEEEADSYETPPSSPLLSSIEELDENNVLEDTISLPDTFIYPGAQPSKTDLAVMEAISDCQITCVSHPAIYRWRHLVQLHKDHVLPCGQVAPSPGAWHRRRLAVPTPSPCSKESTPSSPLKQQWERVTGAFSPRRSRISSASPR